MFKLGKIKLDSQSILAPMAGVNCASFRLLCREYGAGMVSTAMIHTNQIVNNTENTIKRTCFLEKEKPLCIQLVGADSREMKEAVNLIEDYADVLDLNLGCPEKEILASKAGAFLVKHPDQIKKAVKPIIDNTNKTVTAKIRIGWDENSINTLEVVKILEDLGVDGVAIHGRTKTQSYMGKANWDEIRKAKENSNVIIIGNGDIFKAGTAKAMLEQTKCDFVMVGRGAMGNPLLFDRIKHLLEKGENKDEITEKEKVDCFTKFLKYYQDYEHMRSFSELRQQAMWFMKGIEGVRAMRNKIMRSNTVEEILDIIK